MSNATDVERVEQIVLGNQIYCAAASTFNDPFDLNPVFSFNASPETQREDYLRMSRKFQPHLSEKQHQAEASRVMETSLAPNEVDFTARMMQAVHRQAIVEKVGTFCVSEKRDDLLMWAHYSDSHHGICLEFDGFSTLMAQAQPVCYSANRHPINPYEDDQITALEKALFTKSEHWSYEAEWRFLRLDGPGQECFDPPHLTGIVVGALATPETIQTVKSWSSKRSAPLALYQASISSKEFKLLIDPLR